MADVTKDDFDGLDARLKALENLKTKLDGAAAVINWARVCIGCTVATIIAGVVGFTWNYSKVSSSVEYQKESISALKTDLEKLQGRLQSWEDKDFKRKVGAVFEEGVFVSLKENKITISATEDGKPVERTYSIDPEMSVSVGGNTIALKLAKLQPKAPIKFMTTEDGKQVTAIEILPK